MREYPVDPRDPDAPGEVDHSYLPQGHKLMRPERVKTGRVEIPDYCGGTYCDVVSIADRETAQVYDHVMTEEGAKCLMPDGSLQKTCLDHEVDNALHLLIGTVPRGKMIIMSGPSASGKSTRARKILARDGHCIRINRDDLRFMALTAWDPHLEKFIVAAEQSMAKTAREMGHNVIIDDTNLTDFHLDMWKTFAKENFFRSVEVQKIKTPLAECIARDAVRKNWRTCVGRPVIELQFLKGKLIDWGTKPVVFCDLDGTLADMRHRAHWATGICPVCNGNPVLESGDVAGCSNCDNTGKVKKDWVKFEQLCINDTPVEAIVTWLKALAEDHTIVLMSGRQIALAGRKTIEWLAKNEIPYDHLFMRQNRDGRKDVVIKNELLKLVFESGLPLEQIAFAIDDRLCVIEEVWRANAVRVFPVYCRDEPLP